MSVLSHSEFGEDLYLLDHIATSRPQTPHTLLEAGAFDPIHLSNSRTCILSGWEALLVEPNAIHMSAHRELYQATPTVHLYPYILSDHEYETYLDGSHDPFTALWREGMTGTPVHATTISHLLQESRVAELGILFLDTEGTEPKILSRMFLEQVFPAYICVENHDETTALRTLISGQGYTLLTRLGFNDIFVR